jgi:hypothetical protein
VQFQAPGNDTVSIVDIGTDPANPRIVASLPLQNSIFGPPTNLAITPDGTLALVANSMNWTQEGTGWKPAPDNRVHVIDLTTSPPRQIDTVAVGRQPSGMSINRAGTLALIANRADNSVSVLSISGKSVKLVENVAIGEQVAHVAFTPDGRRALAAKFPGHKVALLEVDGQKVTYSKRDLAVGLWPYNLGITPNGELALTADNGNNGGSDGNVDTVSVIDLQATPPARHRQGRRGRRAGGIRGQSDGSPCGRRPAPRLQQQPHGVVLQSQRFGRAAADRRQEGHQGRRGGGARAARGRGVQPRWPLALRRQFP